MARLSIPFGLLIWANCNVVQSEIDYVSVRFFLCSFWCEGLWVNRSLEKNRGSNERQESKDLLFFFMFVYAGVVYNDS